MRWYHGDINIGYRHSTDGGARWFMMVAYSPKGLFLGEMARIGEEKKSNLSHQPATDWNLLYIDIHVRHITYTSTVCKKNMLHMNLYIHQITPNDIYIYLYSAGKRLQETNPWSKLCHLLWIGGIWTRVYACVSIFISKIYVSIYNNYHIMLKPKEDYSK